MHPGIGNQVGSRVPPLKAQKPGLALVAMPCFLDFIMCHSQVWESQHNTSNLLHNSKRRDRRETRSRMRLSSWGG